MKLYRFSPIRSEEELLEAIRYIHEACYSLCFSSFGKYFSNAGNVGVFCHYDDEYEFLSNVRKVWTKPSYDLNQKYFELYKPIVIPATEKVPEAIYTYLYIRKPDPYRHHTGDVDFFIENDEYDSLKSSLLNGNKINGARIFPREDLDMVEVFNPDVDALAYISPRTMTEKVRIKQSEVTNL